MTPQMTFQLHLCGIEKKQFQKNIMKRIIPFILSIVIPLFSFSQVDSVSIGAGYIYQTYYSFENGKFEPTTSDWDLAFGIGGFNVDIRTNDGHDVKLYLYPNGDTSSWNNVDTNGLGNWSYRFNGENNWGQTAFTDPNANHPDYGWGIYNSTTHNIEGDSMYIIETKAGDFKKLKIDGMFTNGNFEFTYADLDGSNEVAGVVSKTNYLGKNFVYYSIDNDSVLDLEPMAADWDIVFTKYRAAQPQGGHYNVTGIQTNRNRMSAEARGVDISSVNWSTQNYTDDIGVIGWDWKSFNMNTFAYDVADSLTYFVSDTNTNVWQITMTGFDYQTGTFHFNKTEVTSVGVDDFQAGTNTVNVFPNPAIDNLTISIHSSETQNNLEVTVFSLTGTIAYRQSVSVTDNLNVNIPVSEWTKGVYLVRIGNDANAVIKKLIIQ